MSKSHLAGHELWSGLESLRTSLPDYREECLVFLGAISVVAQTRRYAGCPIEQTVGERPPVIASHYAGGAYEEALSVAVGRNDFGDFSYERRPSSSSVNVLWFRAQEIAHGSEADVDRLESAHRRLRKRFLKDSRARNIVAMSKQLGQAIDVAVAGLEPNLARKLILAGVCERCP